MEENILGRLENTSSFKNFEEINSKRTFTRILKSSENSQVVAIVLKVLSGRLHFYYQDKDDMNFVPEFSILLQSVKEVRLEKGIESYNKSSRKKYSKRSEDSWLTIFYGSDFVLSSISLGTQSLEEPYGIRPYHLMEWRNALLKVIKSYCELPYNDKLDFWILNSFYEILNKDESADAATQVTLESLKVFTLLICYPISSVDLQRQFQEKSNNGMMNFDAFYTTIKSWLGNEQIFNTCFGLIPPSQLIMSELLPDLDLEQNNSGNEINCCDSVVDFLFSKRNSITFLEDNRVDQNMTQPLSHYWIASSHNTYLTGNQITSESSVEAYVRCLRLNCRCIELDCWDGKDGNPIIYHGRTRTTKIPFHSVLRAIKEHAFETSKYPVILSIENHCGIKQQKIMAKKFEEVFGSMLIQWAVNEKENCLLSPENLKEKIILKCKKLMEKSSYQETQEPLNVFPIIHSGVMYIQNHYLEWQPYFFGLNQNHLLFQIPSSQTLQDLDEDGNQNQDRLIASSSENLHLHEKWFHFNVDLNEVNDRILRAGMDGAFLVREDSSKNGNFDVCFMHKSNICHKSILVNDAKKVFQLDNEEEKFHSLFSLICYYQNNPFKLNETAVKLQVPLSDPGPSNPIRKAWFYPDMDEKAADSVLERVNVNGAFLVYSLRNSMDESKLVISFRYANEIKHCQIRETGTSLMVNAKTFSSIIELVDYYQIHPFYRGTKLEYPVVKDLCSMAQSSNLQKVASVEATVSYTPLLDDENMLSFEKGDIITKVWKKDENIWIGNLGNQLQKGFSPKHVRVIHQPNFDVQEGFVGLGKVEIIKCNSPDFPYIIEIMSEASNVFRAAVKTEEEAKTWQTMIHNECLKNQDLGEDESTSKTVRSILGTLFKSTGGASRSSSGSLKIAPELSNLVCFATGSKISLAEIEKYPDMPALNELASYSESIAKTIVARPGKFCRVHAKQLCRIYPLGTRFNSSNFNPLFMWNTGCQLVALNYQTPDKWMQVNLGKFFQNGNCGYVLKPDYMLNSDTFNPNDPKCLEELHIPSLLLSITVIAGRHLTKRGNKPVLDPMVKLEVLGADFDLSVRRTRQRVAWGNGFCPYWNQKFTFHIRNPDLAIFRIVVQDKDSFNDSYFIGHATYPVRSLRPGYRSVQLFSEYGDELFGVLLANIEITDFVDTK